MILWLWEFEVLVDSENHCWSHVGRTESVASADDERSVLLSVEGILHVEVERFAVSSWLLSAVEDSNALNRLWNSCEETFYREWAIEVYRHHTVLLAVGVCVVDGFASGLCSRAHEDDAVGSVLSSVVSEWFVLATCNLRDGSHVLFNSSWHFVVEWVARLAVSEECLRVLSHTLSLWVLW